VLTVAVKVLTKDPFLSRPWVKFSNRYLTGGDAGGRRAGRLTGVNP
jgi:hypothetical protein